MEKLHTLDSLENMNEFIKNPFLYFKADSNWVRPLVLSYVDRI